MKPHFFGKGDDRRYGVYDEPRTDVPDAPAVLVCYPIAGEYMRAHRACRQLANLLTRRGAHVMRFDYFGTGDSPGRSEDGDLDRWEDDVRAATEELIALSRLDTVRVVGLRLGGSLALRAGSDDDRFQRVVMWDPIVDGNRYANELEEKHRLEQLGRGGSDQVGGTIGVNGFALSRHLRDQLRTMDLRQHEMDGAPPVRMVVSSQRDEWAAMAPMLEERGDGSGYEVVPSEGDWGEADEFGSALIPQQIITSVVERLMSEDE